MLPVNNGIYAEYSLFDYNEKTNQWTNSASAENTVPVTMECYGAQYSRSNYVWFNGTDTSYAKFTYGSTPDVLDTHSDWHVVYALLYSPSHIYQPADRSILYNSPTSDDTSWHSIMVEEYGYCRVRVNDKSYDAGMDDVDLSEDYYLITLVMNSVSGNAEIYINGELKSTLTGYNGCSTSTYIGKALSKPGHTVYVKYLAFGDQQHFASEIQQNYQYLYDEFFLRWNYINGKLVPKFAPAVPKESMSEPYPKSVWRMDPWWNNGFPYTMLMPNVHHVTPPDPGYDSIEFLDKVRVISIPHGLDRLFPVTKIRIPLDKPSETKYTVGTTVPDSFTASSAAANGALSKKVSEIPPPSSILKMAADNASKIINNATTGYVTLHKNGDLIDEIIISDEEDYTKAQRIWRWNSGGLGYSSTGYNGTYGTAITMDGSIVADRVTTGTMHADRIRGGELVLGGYDNVNGIFKLVDENGKVMITMTREGIDMKSADRDGYFLNLKDGQLYGGKGETVWGRLSPTIQTETDDPDRPMHGLWIDGACINITPTELNIGDHDDPLTVWSTFTGTIDVVTDVNFASETVTKTTLTFKHGVLL